MIKIIRANERHFSDFEWLKTFWLFSFSDYFDPNNLQFGALRVFNDDIVEPMSGFPTHPHKEMEIITLAIDGEITHEDSMGNKAVIKAGDVQRMTAGTGLTHSEYNLTEYPVHFYQIWFYPDKAGLEPSYDQKSFAPEDSKNRLQPIASGQGLPDVVTFNTDATIYRADLDAEIELDFEPEPYRRIFIYLTEGDIKLNNERLKKRDQARIDPLGPLSIKAKDDSSLILIDVPSCKGFGYDKRTLRGEKK